MINVIEMVDGKLVNLPAAGVELVIFRAERRRIIIAGFLDDTYHGGGVWYDPQACALINIQPGDKWFEMENIVKFVECYRWSSGRIIGGWKTHAYTPGPYTVGADMCSILTDYRDEYGNSTKENYHHGGHPKIIAQGHTRKWHKPWESMHTLERLKDCFNACEGIPTEDLPQLKGLYGAKKGSKDND
ncbi:MAG: hypothetical protein GY820_17360 [Gammaproteobacteria bacterium]|nr:hypothetical protein [Gammaproteobacteria bacterium]